MRTYTKGKKAARLLTYLFACLTPLLLLTCPTVDEEALSESTESGSTFQYESTASEPDQTEEETYPDLPEEAPFDPYAGHETWCEELKPPPCSDNADCTPSKIGRERRCVKPFWYEPKKGEKSGLCVPVYLGWSPKQEKLEIQRRKARLREIVRDRCKPPAWWHRLMRDYGHVDCGRIPGRSRSLPVCLEKRYCDPDKLFRALSVVVKRESDWRMSKAHNLPADVEASTVSWMRACARELYPDNPYFGSCVKQKKKWLAVGNDWERWRTYGYYGQNSNYRMLLLDKKGPPELLCNEVYSTEAYRRALRRTWHKYDRGLDCKDARGRRYNRKLIRDGKQKRDKKIDTWPEKTWYTLHRVASSGSYCPRDRKPEQEGVKTKRRYYGNRMAKVGLDLDEKVTLEMLGRAIPQESLHTHVQALLARLDEKYPPT